jgi:hypothetical protein
LCRFDGRFGSQNRFNRGSSMLLGNWKVDNLSARLIRSAKAQRRARHLLHSGRDLVGPIENSKNKSFYWTDNIFLRSWRGF